MTRKMWTIFALLMPITALAGPGQSKRQIMAQDRVLEAVKKAQRVDAESITSEDCSIQTVTAFSGKCILGFKISGKDEVKVYNANPEVAAVYANTSPYVNPPNTNLWLVVVDDEIIRINDKEGQLISKKIDFSK